MLDLENWQEKKYKTAGGREIRLLCVDAPGQWPVKGVDVAGDLWEWALDGKSIMLHDRKCMLVNATPEPVTVTRWVCVFAPNHIGSILWASESEASAALGGRDDMVTPVTITFTPKG